MTALEFCVFPGATSPVGFYLLRSAPCIPRSLMDSVRGWSQIANICQQNMQPDKTALDICHACFRMCAATSVDTLNLHVDLLGDRTTSVSACADGLVKRLLLCTGDALCLRRPPKVLWHVLLHIMIVCTTWHRGPFRECTGGGTLMHRGHCVHFSGPLSIGNLQCIFVYHHPLVHEISGGGIP